MLTVNHLQAAHRGTDGQPLRIRSVSIVAMWQCHRRGCDDVTAQCYAVQPITAITPERRGQTAPMLAQAGRG